MIENILWIIALSYALFTLRLFQVWKKLPQSSELSAFIEGEIELTVVVPVRNESENILELLSDLEQQHLPFGKFEVLIVDDASTDDTREKVLDFHANTQMNLMLIPLNDSSALSPKKRAIATAVKQGRGKYIVATDGDCRVERGWLASYYNEFKETNAKFISGPVTFLKEEQLSDYLQTVEFASLIGSGACAIASGYPTMCNGANLGYEKATFIEVGGFTGVDMIASGDDEFLLHKIAELYPKGIVFLKSEEAIVRTGAHKTWDAFYNQRKRWASKWKHYKSKTPSVLAIYIFLCNAMLIAGLVAWFLGAMSGHTYLALVLLKCLPEWLFVGVVLRFLKKENAIIYIPVVQIIYPFYVSLFGLAGQKEGYVWKGRSLK